MTEVTKNDVPVFSSFSEYTVVKMLDWIEECQKEHTKRLLDYKDEWVCEEGHTEDECDCELGFHPTRTWISYNGYEEDLAELMEVSNV